MKPLRILFFCKAIIQCNRATNSIASSRRIKWFWWIKLVVKSLNHNFGFYLRFFSIKIFPQYKNSSKFLLHSVKMLSTWLIDKMIYPWDVTNVCFFAYKLGATGKRWRKTLFSNAEQFKYVRSKFPLIIFNCKLIALK